MSPALIWVMCLRCSAFTVAGTSNLRPVLPPIPDLQGKDVRANWNAVALAFLGDTVWEVTVYLSTSIQ